MVKIALMGFGVVGSGVVEVLSENSERIARSAGDEVLVKYILDVRDFPDSPFSDRVIHDFELIEEDPEIRLIVETIGGTGLAYDFTKRGLLAGKSVVTSNKELVAARGQELLAIAKEKNVNYLFEASVGGGVPIIRPITQCLAANNISEIYGILNGTTNYILTSMMQNRATFDDALRQAQEQGFAERKPIADISGADACRKICILSDLSFGKQINPDEIFTEGIDGITMDDMKYAASIGCKIKLVARALRTSDNTITAYVAPHLIHSDSLLASVDGVMNGIVVHGDAIGEVMFYGKGAGARPTASAIIADIIDAVRHFKNRRSFDWNEYEEGFVSDSKLIKSRWFVRMGGSLADIGSFFGNVRFVTYDNAPDGDYAFLTGPMDVYDIKKRTDRMDLHALYRILD